ncbi:MAG: carboxypeptidase-like regulatory domain-containing protein [Ferruginibacter sp.]
MLCMVPIFAMYNLKQRHETIIYILTALNISAIGLAQTNGKVVGIIKDDGDQKIIDAATVSLLNSRDSGLVKSTSTDKDGNFAFENIKDGNYFVMATSVSHIAAL